MKPLGWQKYACNIDRHERTPAVIRDTSLQSIDEALSECELPERLITPLATVGSCPHAVAHRAREEKRTRTLGSVFRLMNRYHTATPPLRRYPGTLQHWLRRKILASHCLFSVHFLFTCNLLTFLLYRIDGVSEC